MKNFSIKKQKTDNTFNHSIGGVGVATGSTSVITINLHYAAYKSQLDKSGNLPEKLNEEIFLEFLGDLIESVQKYQVAHRAIVEDYVEHGLLPVYTAGYITLNKQYVTLGINGLNESAEFFGYKVSNNQDYKDYLIRVFSVFTRKNNEARAKYPNIMFNTELVPGESLGPKNSAWDKAKGLPVKRNCYNSYMYLPEDTEISIPDKFELHGGEIVNNLDGGSALHLNIANLPDKEFFLWLRNLAAEHGTTYWTTNVRTTCCETCGMNDFRTLDTCPSCGSKDISHASRVIGYLKKISSYSEDRQHEAILRHYH